MLGVVLPGLVLGFMAYRGIRSQEALRERQVRQELNLAAQDFFAGVNSELSDPKMMEPYTLVVMERDSQTRIVSDRILYLPEAYLALPSAGIYILEPDRGWEMEFIENDLAGAAGFYEERIRTGKNRADSRNALARVLRKMGKNLEAAEQYKQLLEDPDVMLASLLPSRLAAGTELARMLLSEGKKDQAAAEMERVAERLLLPELNYGRSTFDLFYQELVGRRDLLQKSDSLISRIDEEAARTDQINRFLPEMEDYLSYPGVPSVYLPKGGYLNLLIIKTDTSGLKHAYLADPGEWCRQRAAALFGFLAQDGLQYRVREENGKVLAGNITDSTLQIHSFPFPLPLTGWTLELTILPQPLLQGLFEPGKGLYPMIFFLIATWLVLGTLFMVYLLNQEMRLNRMRSRFISNVSHEFKSPVTSIRHMSELLKLKRVRSEEKKEEFYDSMIEQCDHLSHMIENVLDFSKIEDEVKKYRFQTIDLIPLIYNAVSLVKDSLEESGMEIRVITKDQTLPVNADPDALKQVIYNLLDNAIKYGRDGRKVEIIVDGGFIVKDFGKGIGEKDLPYIFDRFYRCEEHFEQGIRGSGIGLTIVRRIVEAHGWQICVKSKPGEGTEFIVKLPELTQHT